MINILIALLLIGIIIAAFPIAMAILTIYGLYRLIRYIRKERYFNSPDFLAQKEQIIETVSAHNEIAHYTNEISNNNHFVAEDKPGEYAHLAKFENTSDHNYKRNRNVKTYDSDYIRPSSLQIVRKASEQPIKYLCKYFGISATEENLEQLESIGENISRLENAIKNLQDRETRITEEFNPPEFIIEHYRDELMERLDVEVPNSDIDYTEYIFEYVSDGGNSSQRTTIEFNGETIEATSKYISSKIKYKKSAKAQRALMTNKLRRTIKERDDYTCQICGASTYEQDLLLLEIDHIIPVSKGGMSTPDNLQTLCWKCNRQKSDKM